jgi:hypothetical protein
MGTQQLAKYQQEDAKINSYFSQYHNILMNPGTVSLGRTRLLMELDPSD